jgi:hypothetical protein
MKHHMLHVGPVECRRVHLELDEPRDKFWDLKNWHDAVLGGKGIWRIP